MNSILWFCDGPEHMCGCGTIVEITENTVTVHVPSMISDDDGVYIYFDDNSRRSRCNQYEREDWNFQA